MSYSIQRIVPIKVLGVRENGLSLRLCPTNAPGRTLCGCSYWDNELDIVLAKEGPFQGVHATHGSTDADRDRFDPEIIENELVQPFILSTVKIRDLR